MFYRVRSVDLADTSVTGEPATGRFRTAPTDRRNVSFVWSGDTAGQGWGIDESRGGMKIYETMRKLRPDFFIHSGDTIYADGAIQAEQKLPDGTLWKNLVLEEKTKVAETLAEYRASYKYNLLDKNLRAFNAEVPMLAQWDDHEVLNNWSSSKNLMEDKRYKEKSIALLSARAARAFHEYMPIAPTPQEAARVYRKVGYGPLLDIFFLDERTYRGPNGENRQKEMSPETAFMGRVQLDVGDDAERRDTVAPAVACVCKRGGCNDIDWRCGAALSQPRGGSSAHHARHSVRRHLSGRRHRMGARRSAFAHAGRGIDHQKLREHRRGGCDRGDSGKRFYRQGAARRSACGSGYFLSRGLCGHRLADNCRGASDRPLAQRAGQ